MSDNRKEQNINVDVAFELFSVVVLIEKSGRIEAILPQIKHLGSLLPLVVGDHGEAAIVAFDSRLTLMQDFTEDPDKLKVAIDKINAGNSSARMIDAVDHAVFMLRKRRAARITGKIILLVSETRDQASEGKVRESLIDAQLSNVLVYTVDITQLATRLTEKPQPPRPNAIDVTAYNLAYGASPPTPDFRRAGLWSSEPGSVHASADGNLVRTPKGSLFDRNPSEVFSKGTGGAEITSSFVKERGFEDAHPADHWHRNLRSQYLISYRPNNSDESGFHQLSVTVENPAYVAKTRPGYWLGGGKAQ